MRLVVVLAGVVLVLVGILWILQGIGLAKGSFMTGHAFWGWMGGVAVVVGVPVLVAGLRRAGSSGPR